MMCNLLILMVPIIGVEPTTFALRISETSDSRCSHPFQHTIKKYIKINKIDINAVSRCFALFLMISC